MIVPDVKDWTDATAVQPRDAERDPAALRTGPHAVAEQDVLDDVLHHLHDVTGRRAG